MKGFAELVAGSRSVRRFDETVAMRPDFLAGLIDLARLSPSSGNMQPLKFMVSATPERNALIFPCLKWAGLLKDWGGPKPGERPTGYVLVMTDESIIKDCNVDVGIAAQTMMLGARAGGFGGCMIASADWDSMRRDLGIPAHLRLRLVLALGKPVEKIVLEDVIKGGSLHYWRDQDGVHHVPKRSLDDILVEPGKGMPGIDGSR